MRQPVALLVNDLHVTKDTIADFNANWDEALSVCGKRGVADLVVGGDMFTERASQTLPVLLAVKGAIGRAVAKGLRVTIAEGNHDLPSPEAAEGYNHLWAGLEGVDVVDSGRALAWDGCDFVLLVMSYFPEAGSFLDRLEEASSRALEEYPSEAKSESDIILYMHEGVHGALGDFDIEGELPQEPFKKYRAVLCGHYHNRVRIKGTSIEYIGSSRQHNFGEDEEKGYTLLFSDGGTEFVKNKANLRFKTVELDASDLASLECERREGYRYRVKVSCREGQSALVDRQKLLDMGFSKVEVSAKSPSAKKAGESAITEKYDRSGIVREYVGFCGENGIDSELGVEYFNKTGHVESD